MKKRYVVLSLLLLLPLLLFLLRLWIGALTDDCGKFFSVYISLYATYTLWLPVATVVCGFQILFPAVKRSEPGEPPRKRDLSGIWYVLIGIFSIIPSCAFVLNVLL